MFFTLKIETDNAAFEGDRAWEVARILRKTADELEIGLEFYSDRTEGGVTLSDANGNDVGYAMFEVPK